MMVSRHLKPFYRPCLIFLSHMLYGVVKDRLHACSLSQGDVWLCADDCSKPLYVSVYNVFAFVCLYSGMVHYNNSYRVKNIHIPFSEPLPCGTLLSRTALRVMASDSLAQVYSIFY